MKKILLSLFVVAVMGFTAKVQAQCNLTTPLIKYTSGTGIAPFNIGESPNAIVDWETYILGTGTGDATTPFNPPSSSAANFSLDGTGTIGPDLDSPQPPRDLRFFAFTYDNYNVYFYFRRINNSNSQNTFMYLLDVNADGFMNNGEPVIRANFNSGSVSAFAIHQYIVDVGTDYVAGKGNYMTKPTAPNAGLADGYSVAGSMNNTGETLPSLLANEIFAASITESGFGVEFAVPWRYLKNYLTNTTPLIPGDVFTYHVSTQNGTGVYVTSGASDNAGGCCSGLAVVGSPNYIIESISTTSVTPSLEYLLSVKVKNNTNAPAKVSLDNVVMGNIVQYLGRPINQNDFLVKGYIDGGVIGVVDGTDAATELTFNYLSGTFASQPIIYTSPIPRDTISLTASGGFAYFLIDLRLPTNYSVKSLQITVETSGILNLPLGPCQQAGVPNQATAPVGITTTLPVEIKSFTASRNRSNVLLKWTTMAEQNNTGFAVERNIAGNWEQIGFVASQAPGGNSSDLLNYAYNDVNSTKGITQYRIRQIDFDSRSRYSEIRSVRGESQGGQIIVYPNPSIDGKVNVSFEDAATRDISVTDMSGRVIRQIKGHTNNNITFENLTPGMYSLRVIVPATGEQTIAKFVVSKR